MSARAEISRSTTAAWPSSDALKRGVRPSCDVCRSRARDVSVSRLQQVRLHQPTPPVIWRFAEPHLANRPARSSEDRVQEWARGKGQVGNSEAVGVKRVGGLSVTRMGGMVKRSCGWSGSAACHLAGGIHVCPGRDQPVHHSSVVELRC
jgi:hypothetical protein